MNSTFISIRNLTCVLGATALLSMAGCGSGGGGGSGAAGGTTAPVKVTGAQSQSLAKVSLSGLTMSSLGSGMSSLGAKVTGVQVAGTSSRGMSVRNLIDYVVQQVETKPSTPQELTGAILMAPSACQVSGTVGMSDTRANNSAQYTANDSITMTFSNCVNVSGGSSLDGSIVISNMTFTNCASSTGCPLASATMTFNFVMATPASGAVPADTFTMTNVVINHVNNGTTTIDSMTGTSIKDVFGTTTDEISNFNFSSTLTNATLSVSDISNFTIGSTTIGGSITVATPTPFVTASGVTNPTSGVMEVTSNVTPPDLGALRITVNGNNITVDFYQYGFNSAFTTSNNYTWTTI